MHAILETDDYERLGFPRGSTLEVLGENSNSGSLLVPIPLGAYHSKGCVINPSPSYDEFLHLDREYGWIPPNYLTIINGAINNRNMAKELLEQNE